MITEKILSNDELNLLLNIAQGSIENNEASNNKYLITLFDKNFPESVGEISSSELASVYLYNYFTLYPNKAIAFINEKYSDQIPLENSNDENTQKTFNLDDQDTLCAPATSPVDYYNYIKHEHSRANEGISTPQTLEDIYKIVKSAEGQEKQVRCVGNGHSYSDVSMTEGNIIKMCNLINEDVGDSSKWDKSWITESYKDKIFISVLGGTSIAELNELLDRKGLAMSNQAGADVQTVAGVLSTSTHGSGKDYGCIADLVRSMVIVNSSNSPIVRLEPTNGITKRELYDKNSNLLINQDGQRLLIELIQDDNLFYGALVSMGSMGIIYSVVLEVEKAFNLLEDRKFIKLDDLKSIFSTRIDDQDHFFNLPLPNTSLPPRHVEFYINPYKVGESHHCILTRRFQTPQGERGKEQRGQRGWPIAIDKSNLNPEMAYALFTNVPSIIPGFLRAMLYLLEDEVGGKGDGYEDKSFNVLNAGITKYTLSGTGIEICVKFEKALNFIEDVLIEIDNLRKQGIHLSTPIGVRFIKGSKAHLAIMTNDVINNDETSSTNNIYCTIEIPVIISKRHSNNFNTDIRALMHLQEWTINKKERLHWGLSFKSPLFNDKYLKDVYGSKKLDLWIAAFKKFNQKKVFCNSFTKRMGFDKFL
ncbi:MAG: FAD-binding protein [Bacteroidia bacterium]